MSVARAFFDAIAGRYERSYALPADESRRRMTAVLRELPPPPARVLDLGVGTGRELSALLDAGHVPTGLDVSAAMLERCARRARSVVLVRADFWESLPVADDSFDATIALHGTLAHPPDEHALGRLAGELARVVRREGVWIAEVPSPAWLERLETLPPSREGRAYRTGPSTFSYRDAATGASLDGRVFSEQDWRAALGRRWSVRVVALGPLEWMVIATRG